MTRPEIISITRKIDTYQDPYYYILTTIGVLKARIQENDIYINTSDIPGREEQTKLSIGNREYRASAHISENGDFIDNPYITNRGFVRNDTIPKTHKEKILELFLAINAALRKHDNFQQDRKNEIISNLQQSLASVEGRIKKIQEELNELYREKNELENKLGIQ